MFLSKIQDYLQAGREHRWWWESLGLLVLQKVTAMTAQHCIRNRVLPVTAKSPVVR
jgi:hypothetical protein